MSNVMCVTNRLLCEAPFLERIEQIAKSRPKAIILREKDLSAKAYQELAKEVMAICKRYEVTCILHSHVSVAKALKNPAIHLPLPILRTLPEEVRKSFSMLGASCHSVLEAQEAQNLNCTYIIAGHIFATDCKKDLPPRGLAFLSKVCQSVQIPVWAIGGISPQNISSIPPTKAQGICLMSSLMQCQNPTQYIKTLSCSFTTFH
ncbi:MAG: thiamine phosphate synthase [Cellulosilyticum sp.]|nr:thiamine phosphate synthase [Cellulosilyticum sp.]